MKIYNSDKTIILSEDEIDLSKGKLISDSIDIEEQPFIEDEFHYEIIAEYENGGKDVKRVVDKPGQPFIAAHQETIKVYVPYTEKELEDNELTKLRSLREVDCFPIINRGALWYNNLTEEQLDNLDEWYRAWLDVTDTKVVPDRPSWLK